MSVIFSFDRFSRPFFFHFIFGAYRGHFEPSSSAARSSSWVNSSCTSYLIIIPTILFKYFSISLLSIKRRTKKWSASTVFFFFFFLLQLDKSGDGRSKSLFDLFVGHNFLSKNKSNLLIFLRLANSSTVSSVARIFFLFQWFDIDSACWLLFKRLDVLFSNRLIICCCCCHIIRCGNQTPRK